MNTTERFWMRVTKSDGCWTHSGSLGSHGYPQATSVTGKGWSEPAHRVSWMIHNGTIPDGLFVCHRCNNRLCVRPDHLYLGTHKQNMDDMARAGHPNRRLTNEDAEMIRQSTDTQVSLAKRFGLHPRSIANIKRGITYRYAA